MFKRKVDPANQSVEEIVSVLSTVIDNLTARKAGQEWKVASYEDKIKNLNEKINYSKSEIEMAEKIRENISKLLQ